VSFADLQKKKSDVYAQSYVPLAKAIDAIQGKNKHTPQELILVPKEETPSSVSSELQHYIESYHTLLYAFEKMLYDTALLLERTQETKERDVALKDAVKLLKKSKRLLGLSLLDAQEEVSLEAIAVLRKAKRFDIN